MLERERERREIVKKRFREREEREERDSEKEI